MEVRKTRVSSKVLVAAHDPFNLGRATGAQPGSTVTARFVTESPPPIASCDAYIATPGVTAKSLWSMLTRNDDLPCYAETQRPKPLVFPLAAKERSIRKDVHGVVL
jgi:hypothetical protein